MKRSALLAILVASSALAQSEPPPPPPVEEPSEGITLSQAQAAKAERFSRFSAGPGGVLLLFSEALGGLVTGALLGQAATNTGRGAYVGGLLGGLIAGGGAAAYQYYVPVQRGAAGMSFLAGASLALAGYGIGLQYNQSPVGTAVMGAVGFQVGTVAALTAAGEGDFSSGDLGVVGSAMLYVLVLSGLVNAAVAPTRGPPVELLVAFVNPIYAPVLYAFYTGALPLGTLLMMPALGLAVGAAFAFALDVSPKRLLTLTALPLGVGLVALYLGLVANVQQLAPATALVAIGVTFALTALLGSAPPEPASGEPTASWLHSLRPVPVITAAGVRNESVALGPGLLGRF